MIYGLTLTLKSFIRMTNMAQNEFQATAKVTLLPSTAAGQGQGQGLDPMTLTAWRCSNGLVLYLKYALFYIMVVLFSAKCYLRWFFSAKFPFRYFNSHLRCSPLPHRGRSGSVTVDQTPLTGFTENGEYLMVRIALTLYLVTETFFFAVTKGVIYIYAIWSRT